MHNDPKALGANLSLGESGNRKSIGVATRKFIKENRSDLSEIQNLSGIDVSNLESASFHPYGCEFDGYFEPLSLTVAGWPLGESGAYLTPGEALMQYDRIVSTDPRLFNTENLYTRENYDNGTKFPRNGNERFSLDHSYTVVGGFYRNLVEFVGHPYGIYDEEVSPDILKLIEMGWSAMISPYSEYHETAIKVALSRRISYGIYEAEEIDRYIWDPDLSHLHSDKLHRSKTMSVVGVVKNGSLLIHHPLVWPEINLVLGQGPGSRLPLWRSMSSSVRSNVPVLSLRLTKAGVSDLIMMSDDEREDYLDGDYFV